MKLKPHTIELYRDRTAKKEWRWRMIAANGRNVANGGEGYKRKGALLRSLSHMFGANPISIKEGDQIVGAIQPGHDA